MSPDLEPLFEAAWRLTEPAQRKAFLDAACRDKPALRQELEQLLAMQGEADGLFEPGAAALDTGPGHDDPALSGPVASSRMNEKPGDRLGRYKLLQKIGEGGCGGVYMAEQEEPVRRRVALKVIKLGMDTKSVIARFEAERQALAMMDHPNIAKVFDGGATETGRPYFVMELVRGIRITEYCDEAKLSTPERLDLFIQVCQAVQHAHQKGVIHRDLKPSNILVTINDGVPVPKVIDFGIAKATGQQRLTDKTVFTAFEQFIGTPTYVSPEQAAMTSLDIDTRSDIYSLGVLLYELLTGKTPFDSTELLKVGLDEMRRTIREKEPPRPSTRLNTLSGEDLTTAANRRQTEAPKLIHLIEGDLDWIVMKSLEKDRTRRYETANGLAADVKRFLNHEPVVARPPSATYRLQKLVRRNKLAFAAGTAVVAALVIGLVASTLLFIRETKAHGRALAAEHEQARLLEQAERAEQAKTEELRRSHLAVARASRQSGEPGRRFASLAAIAKAAAIGPSLELRNEAIAALALTDLGQPRVWRASIFTGDWEWDHNFAFDADLQRYAVGTPDRSISICRVADQQELVRLPPASAEARTLVFSPDGKFLAVRHDDGWVRVWDLNRRATMVEAQLASDLRWSLDFSPDNRHVVAGSTNNLVRCFDVASGKETNSLPVSLSPVAVLFAPTGRVLAVRDWSQCQLWHWEQRTLLRTLSHPGRRFTAWAWHPDGIRFASGCNKEEVYLWDTLTGNHRILRPYNSYEAYLVFSPRGDLLVSCGWDSTTRTFDAQTCQPILTTQSGYAWRFSRDSQGLAFYRENGELGVWPVVSPRVFRTLNTQVPPPNDQRVVYHSAFSPDGRFLLWGQNDGLRWLDLVSGEIGYRKLTKVVACAFRPDGNSLITASQEGLLNWPVERETNSASVTLRLGPAARVSTRLDPGLARFAISQDGRMVIAGGSNEWSLIESGGPERVMKYPLRSGEDKGFVVSPDKRWVGLGAWAGSAFVCDARTGEPAKEFPDVRGGIMAFTPDGRWLVTCSGQEYRFWETGTWRAGLVIKQDLASRAGGAIAFAPDGGQMAIARTVYLVQLLDPKSDEVLADLAAPNPQQIRKLCFSPDGGVLAVSGDEGIHLWDLRALRRELAALKLDWNQPPYAPSTNSLADVVFRYVPDDAK